MKRLPFLRNVDLLIVVVDSNCSRGYGLRLNIEPEEEENRCVYWTATDCQSNKRFIHDETLRAGRYLKKKKKKNWYSDSIFIMRKRDFKVSERDNIEGLRQAKTSGSLVSSHQGQIVENETRNKEIKINKEPKWFLADSVHIHAHNNRLRRREKNKNKRSTKAGHFLFFFNVGFALQFSDFFSTRFSLHFSFLFPLFFFFLI